MAIDQLDVSNAIEGATSVSGDSCLSGDVNMEDSLNCDAKNDGNVVIGNLQNDKYIYRQDVVRHDERKLIGVVTEVAGDSDSESGVTDDDDDDEDDDDDDDEEDSDEDDKEEEEGEEGGNVENEGDCIKDGDDNESSDGNKSSDHHKRDPLTGDQVRVLWMDDSETMHSRNELTVVDRGFLHGDYVASSLDPTGQVGLVVDVNITVDLLSPDGSVIKDVSSRELKRVRDIVVGDYVVSGPWLGRVDDVLDNVTVQFDDGSVCKVAGAEPLRLKPIAKNLLEDGHCPYYPGQRVRGSSSFFKNARWLSGTWKANRLEATVTKVTVGSVYVHWIASAGYGPDSSISPPEEQNPKTLKLLSCFTHANWQLGDWCLHPSLALSSAVPLDKGLSKLRLNESKSDLQECDEDEVIPEQSNGHVDSMELDGVGTSESSDVNAQSSVSPKSSSCGSSLSVSKDTVNDNWPIHRKKLRKVVVKRDKKARKKEENFERALLIINTKTRADVSWQDGTVQHGLDSTLLIPIESPGDHDFVAEQYVVEKATDDGEEASNTRRVGVVKSGDAKEKTACVKWLKQVSRPEEPREFEKEEVVSVYELEGHPDYDYCYGDVVVRLSPVFMATEVAFFDPTEKDWISDVENGDKGESGAQSGDKQGDATDETTRAELSTLSWVGNITGLINGDIEVTWADGMVSTVGPQAVYVVGRDDDESIVAGSDISDDAASWETVEDDETDAHALDNTYKEPSAESTEVHPDAGEDNIIAEHGLGINGPFGAAIGFVTRIASGIFSRRRRDGDSFGSDDSVLSSAQSEDKVHLSDERASSNVSTSKDPCVIDVSSGQTDLNKCEELPEVDLANFSDNVEPLLNLRPKEPYAEVCSNGNVCSFKRFDTAKDSVDHFFLGSNVPGNSGRKWLKKVQRDWNILQNNLPDGIYVRVFEDRMDLLRAVIVGAYGTPYQDGLFFFDFHLPSEYPDVPPSAHYHSGGWRVNPNLYEEGKVCLSLLNTWTGRGNEVWDPQSSSILQVLVSLQGLVLNSKPYFNEAGYDKQIGTAEGEKNSLSYNENTFLLNCKTIMYLIRKPPKDFEDLVKEHFRLRGYYILKACDAYMKGYLIGSLAKDASLTEKSEANATSVGFKLMLAKIVPKLISTLNEIGTDCHDFKHLVRS